MDNTLSVSTTRLGVYALLGEKSTPPENVYLPVILKIKPQPQPTPTPTATPIPTSTPTPQPGCIPDLVSHISVGNTPRGIAIDSTRRRVYVANFGSHSISVIDSDSHSVIRTITAITSANGLTHDPTHNIIWATNYESDAVTPIQVNADATGFTPLSPITVGDGPWGVVYDPIHDYVYVVNNLGDSVTVIEAENRAIVATLSGNFGQPFPAAANPVTGKVHVSNFGNSSVTVITGTTISKVINLFDNTQPYGIAVDQTRDRVYVATVDSHRVVVIGSELGLPDQLLGGASVYRGFGDPERPVPLRVIALNPDIGPSDDGGHIWATTATVDDSEANQVLLSPKGWSGGFAWPVPHDVGLYPTDGIAVDSSHNLVYVASGVTPGTITVLKDGTDLCVAPFSGPEGIKVELFTKP